jgi:hypothetical protein
MDVIGVADRHDPARRLGASYRDPSGFVFQRDGALYRQVNRVYQPDYDKLTASGLYQSLVGDGLIVANEEADVPPAEPETAYKVLKPERVPFVSYPYEWSFGQLKDAALLTLEVHRRALGAGMALKDASAYNVQFVGARPVFIDTLSFEAVRERPWAAYGQFTRHFLAPLALMSLRHVGLGRMLRVWLDGLPLDVASALLPRRTYLSPSLLLHVHLHARAVAGHSDGRTRTAKTPPAFSARSLKEQAGHLESAVRALRWEPEGTEWADYYADSGYAAPAFEHKRRFVARFLDETRPATVWDVGANTGEFSRLASERGAYTVAFDVDPACVERNYRASAGRGEARMLPLLLDALDPSPALGWMNRERQSLFERGPADACLALAAVHHLAVSGNVPLGQVAEFFARAGKTLVVEFVPKADSQFQRLMGLRDDIFTDYSQDSFEAAFGRYFSTVRAERLVESRRTIYEMTALPRG